ncbi:TetR/AcrR family transcriptional regulator C-terminal domain-containing protein [Streptomyces sp. NPDC059398]|uniref:TetR/AcrR family transcriptional regulator C-terminal domain-containing protein n=1 Tax=Streptomyces sp. NPDC059398 TaxID=3346820 RepID=UPI0036C0CC53
MSPVSNAPRGRPARLTRAATVESALELLDEVGIDALTMRRLADRLGVQAGALYRHFATKQDLLTAMADQILGTVTAPGPDEVWSAQLLHLARSMRQALLARRDGARVYGGTHSSGPHTLALAEATVSALRTAGFDDADAARALFTVTNFVLGNTLEEQAAQPDGAGRPAGAALVRDAVLQGGFPHLKAVLPELTGADLADYFEFGLNVVVSGLRATRE